jgi:hypothetical protein
VARIRSLQPVQHPSLGLRFEVTPAGPDGAANFGVALRPLLPGEPPLATMARVATLSDEADDPYLWLEDLDAVETAGWVRERNAARLAALTGSERFAALRAEIRQVLDDHNRIPYPGWRGDHLYYDFWQDAAHPRGLWRRTSLTSTGGLSQTGTYCSTSTRSPSQRRRTGSGAA